MRAAFKTYSCSQENAYVIKLTLRNLVTGDETTLEAVIDTGFDGYVMLTRENYAKLQLSLTEAPEEQFPFYRTLAGTVVFRKSIAQLTLAEKTFITEVITPKHGNGKNLIGKRTLQHFTTIIHKNQMTCMGEADLENG
ncbi:MAG: hypothetical protein NZ921_02405 [Candidatus Caldarchaeum sp.]|nr:hypothetical protein [Candidatus Caldarchaeum sp.]